MKEPYRLRHIPSGLYYMPRNHNNSQLSKKGKIYHDSGNILNKAHLNNKKEIELVIKENSVLHLMTKNDLNYSRCEKGRAYLITNITDWIKEELNDE